MHTKITVVPVSMYDVAGLEAWLSDQASLGLRPTHLGSICTFKKDAVEGARYCLRFKGKGEPEPTIDGWHYALNLGLLYQVYTTTDPHIPPLPKDLAPLVKRVKKAQKWNVLFPIFIGLCFLFPVFYTSKFDAQPDLLQNFNRLLFMLTSTELFLFLVAFLWMKLPEGREMKAFLVDYKASQEGQSFAPWPKKKFYSRNNWIQLCGIPILLVLLILGRLDFKTPLSEFHKPYVNLETLEQVELATYQEHFGAEYSRNFEPDYAQTHYSILATSYYEVVQEGYEGTGNTYTGSRGEGVVYTPELDMTRLTLTVPPLSRWVAENLLDSYRLVNLQWHYEDVTYGDLDFVILATTADPNWQMAALGHGGTVAVFRYGGEMQLGDHLDLLAEMVE
ncbi:hypothetical protein RFF05_00305 [Bengtsoniella intestinalis]|uniref:hypothetical protein n=1 Tax=Bengtsoniella intestinalis TaxID=3073143 RepID=UPI00391F906F